MDSMGSFYPTDRNNSLSDGHFRYHSKRDSNHGFIMIDNDFNIVKINNIAEMIFGVAASQVLGNNISLALHDNINALVIEYLTKHNQINGIKIRFYSHGIERTLLFNSRVIKNRFQRLRGYAFDFQDISVVDEIACTVESHLSLERQHSFVLQTISRGVIAIDVDFNISVFNQMAEKIFGLPAEKVIGRSFDEVFPCNPKAQFIIYRTLMETEYAKYYLECVYKGKQLKLIIDSKIIYDDQGKKNGAIVVIEDITEIKFLQDRNREYSQMEMKQSFILDTMSHAVMSIDENYNINLFNKGAEKILGLATNNVLGKNIYEVFTDLPEECRILENTLKKGVGVNNYHIKFPLNEQVLDFIGNTMLLEDEKGNGYGAVLVFTDVTEVRKQEQIMAQHESLTSVSRMAAGLAHEIRNPLTSIKGFVQLLQHKLKEGVENEYLEIILEELDRTNRLLSDFMLLAKPRKGEMKIFDLRSVLLKTIDFMNAQALLYDVEIKHHLSIDMPKIKGEEEKLKQVFINIIKNAIEAIPDKGLITIDTFISTDSIKVTFTDNGVGIPEENKDKIFEMLYTTKDTGTGLGLSVCSQIIQDHGGSIEVETELGVGTTFTIILPI